MDSRDRLWRQPDFLKLWTGQTVSSFGSMFGALSLTALVFLDATPAEMGLLAMAGGVPALAFALFAGVWIDRVRRRPVMIAADLGRFAALVTIPVAALADAVVIEHLYAVAFVAGVLQLSYELAYRSYLPSVVEREELLEGNARLSATESLAESASPAVGGALVQFAGGPAAVLVDSLTFLWSAFWVAMIRRPETAPEGHGGRAVMTDLADGLRLVWRDRVLRALTGAAGTSRFFGGFYEALYGLFLIRELGFSPLLLGITIGAGGLGGLAGSLLAGRMTRRLGYGGTLLTSSAMMLLFGPMTVLAGGPMELAFAMVFAAQILSDPFWVMYDIAAVSLRQSLAPPRALGRVNSTLHVVQAGLQPLGAVVAGLLATGIGVRETLAVAVVGGAFSIVWLLASPVPGLRGLPHAEAGAVADIT